MTHNDICSACAMPIETCPTCGKLICTEGCVDRMEDGCICATMDEDDDDVLA